MTEENPQLKVRRGERVFGPLTLAELAELLADGRLSESDFVSKDGRNWVTIEEYFAESPADSTRPHPTQSTDDDFVCIPGPSAQPTDAAADPQQNTEQVGFEPTPQNLRAESDDDALPPPAAPDANYIPLSEPDESIAAALRKNSAGEDDELYNFTRPAEGRLPRGVESPPAFDVVEGLDETLDDAKLDDALRALAQDQEQAPEIELPRLSKPAPQQHGERKPRKKKRRRR